MAARSRVARFPSPHLPRETPLSRAARSRVSRRASRSRAPDSHEPPRPYAPDAGRGKPGPPHPGSRSQPGEGPFFGDSLRRYLRVPPGSDHACRVDVDGPNVGARRRLDDVLGEASSRVIVALELDGDPGLAEGVLAARYGVDAEVRQAAPYVRCGVDGAEDRVDGSLALGLGLEDAVLGVRDGDGGPALAARRCDDPERLEDELALEGADLVSGYGLEVGRGHGLLVVRYLLEAREGPFEHLALDVVAELLEGVLERVAARVLAE